MTIKEIIQKLRTTMNDASGQESHFESWLTQNEGICDAIDALRELETVQPQKPLTDEQVFEIIKRIDPDTQRLPKALKQFARAIEAAHGIKENT